MPRNSRPDMNDTLASTPKSSEHGDPNRDWLLIVMKGANVGKIFPLPRNKPLVVIGRGEGCDVQIIDGEISRRHSAIRFDAASESFLVSDLESRNGTRVNGNPCKLDQPLHVGDKIQLGTQTVLRVTGPLEPEAVYARQMYQAVLRDGLTGAFNRRYLDERLESEIAFAKRHAQPLSLLLLDIDHFKQVNDRHGHQAGDAVLQHFYATISEQVRSEDVVARYGGEEFAVLCRKTDEECAGILAERLRRAVEATPHAYDTAIIHITTSIGIACYPSDTIASQAALVEAADDSLYRAKNAGRNRTVRASTRDVV